MGLLGSKEQQKCLKITENRRIKKVKLPIKAAFVADEKVLNAWFRFREYLQILRTNGKGKDYYLPVDERSAMPISPYEHYYVLNNKEQFTKLTDPDNVAEESLNYTSNNTEAENRKTRYYDYMGIAGMGVVFILALVIILFLAGKFHIGGV